MWRTYGVVGFVDLDGLRVEQQREDLIVSFVSSLHQTSRALKHKNNKALICGRATGTARSHRTARVDTNPVWVGVVHVRLLFDEFLRFVDAFGFVVYGDLPQLPLKPQAKRKRCDSGGGLLHF